MAKAASFFTSPLSLVPASFAFVEAAIASATYAIAKFGGPENMGLLANLVLTLMVVGIGGVAGSILIILVIVAWRPLLLYHPQSWSKDMQRHVIDSVAGVSTASTKLPALATSPGNVTTDGPV
ncbi:MAG: hypothetical protein ACYC2H_03900 [Thermoplasmatota archaeon]